MSVSQHVLAIEDRALQLGLVEQHLEDALALDLWRFPEIEAFQKQQVEGVEHHAPPLAARKVGLEFGEVGPPFVDDDHLSVEDRSFDHNIEGRGDQRKAIGPVVTVAGVDPGTLVQVDLQPVAVILDLVQPFAASGGLGPQRCKLRGNKFRHLRRLGAFDHPGDETGLCTLGHYTKRQSNKKTPAA
jgi:hypothetical protein